MEQPFVFKQDTNAYIHVSINPTAVPALTSQSSLDLVCLQVNTNDGWKTICSEPLNGNKLQPTEIDMHGFFYAQTELRVWYKKLGQLTLFN
jgi:hypothetical protein